MASSSLAELKACDSKISQANSSSNIGKGDGERAEEKSVIRKEKRCVGGIESAGKVFLYFKSKKGAVAGQITLLLKAWSESG